MSIITATATLLLVANVLPILPVALDMTHGLSPRWQRRALMRALATGNAVAVVMAIAGTRVLRAWGITLNDFLIAGGTILLIFSIYDLLFSRVDRKTPVAESAQDQPEVGLVPLGIPILVGPAILTTVIVLREVHGVVATLVAIAVNFGINGIILYFGNQAFDRLGQGFGRALGKVMGLMLAALAVAMMRKGITGAIAAS